MKKQTGAPLISIGLISGALLAYEVLLTHLFSIIQTHNFSSLVISLAMLGIGLSGTLTTLLRKKLLQHYETIYIFCLIGCALSMATSFLLGQALPLNGEQLFWDINQIFVLGTLLLLLLIPFLLGGSALSLTYCRFTKFAGKIYGSDLLGAAAGSSLLLLLLFWVFPNHALFIVAATPIVAALVALLEVDTQHPKTTLATILATTALLLFLASNQPLKPSPYKTIEQYRQIKGASIISEHASPLGLIQVMENRIIPIRYAPGLSLVAPLGPPEQLALFINGENLTAINKKPIKPKDEGNFEYLNQMTSALPYHLGQIGSVLLPGLGGGTNILQAKLNKVEKITSVELNQQLVQLLGEDYKDYSGDLFDRVKVHTNDLRRFLLTDKNRYDLIQFATLSSLQPAISGIGGVSENYLYTVEAITEYLSHLSPDGYLALTNWIKNPPRDSLKLLRTIRKALNNSGITDPDRHLVVIRGWQTTTILIKNSRFTRLGLEQVSAFCRTRSFDIAYRFGMGPNEENRYNVTRQPLLATAAKVIISGEIEESKRYIESYKFNIEAATDNKPFFNNFFKWSTFLEIWQLKDSGGSALFETGYPLLITALIIATFISSVLIICPLLLGNEPVRSHKLQSVPGILGYFFLIGVGFLLVEISFIQQFTLFLHHPLYAFTVTVASFLLFAGCGSLLSDKFNRKFSGDTLITSGVVLIVVISLCYLFFLDDFFHLAAGLSFGGKICVSVILICPLATAMGIPFPQGLLLAGGHQDHLVPWCWGVNGCGSVIGSLAATLLAIHLGFNGVLLVAVAAYLLLPFLLKGFKRNLGSTMSSTSF